LNNLFLYCVYYLQADFPSASLFQNGALSLPCRART